MIYIITQRDPFFIDQFIRTFDEYNLPYTVFDMPNFKQGKIAGIRRALQLYGWAGFAKLVVKLLANIPRRKLGNVVEVRKIEQMHELDGFFGNLNADDVVLSLSAPSRIPVEQMPSETLKLNFHCGALPEYAGMMPIFWQVNDEKKEITITLHHMAEQIDEGFLISETQLPVVGTFFELSQKAKQVSAHIFAETIKNRNDIKTINMRQHKVEQLRKFPNKQDVAKIKQIIKII